MTRWITAAAGLCIAFATTCANASDRLEPLRAQFALPTDRIDLLEAKLVIDLLADPRTDGDRVRSEVDRLERVVRDEAPVGATGRTLMDVLVRVLYEPGPWNAGTSFSYDLDDPLAQGPTAGHLGHYLDTRKGNCVSMPLLVLILGQRLGLPVALATAPNHLLVKFGDEGLGAWTNFEATSAQFLSDGIIERELEIPRLAIDNAVYLRPLTPREALVVMVAGQAERFGDGSRGVALMEIADLMLAVDDKNPWAMVAKANAYYIQLQERFMRRFTKLVDIPRDEVEEFNRLSIGNTEWADKVDRSGWVAWTPERRAAYMETIRKQIARRNLSEGAGPSP